MDPLTLATMAAEELAFDMLFPSDMGDYNEEEMMRQWYKDHPLPQKPPLGSTPAELAIGGNASVPITEQDSLLDIVEDDSDSDDELIPLYEQARKGDHMRTKRGVGGIDRAVRDALRRRHFAPRVGASPGLLPYMPDAVPMSKDVSIAYDITLVLTDDYEDWMLDHERRLRIRYYDTVESAMEVYDFYMEGQRGELGEEGDSKNPPNSSRIV